MMKKEINKKKIINTIYYIMSNVEWHFCLVQWSIKHGTPTQKYEIEIFTFTFRETTRPKSFLFQFRGRDYEKNLYLSRKIVKPTNIY